MKNFLLSPPLEVIERDLFGPSEDLLKRWANNDPSLAAGG
jgi:hypothetical protein